MAIKAFDKKLEILSFVIFLHGKLITLALTIEQLGEDASEVREREAGAMQVINSLRREMLADWSGSAAGVMRELRAINSDAQRRVRELADAVDKAQKVTTILARIDKAISLARGLV